MIKTLGIDKFGRETINDGKCDYCIVNKINFETWLKIKRGIEFNAFLSLRPYEKEKIFLQWKWGYSDEKANQELESTRRDIMSQIDRNIEDWYYQELIKFENYCYKIKKEIGLVAEKKPIDYIVQDAQRKDWQ